MSEIRSVSVHLDADVAGYIAKMKLAGDATDQAFSGSSRSITSTNHGLSTMATELDKVDAGAKKVSASTSRMGNDIDRSRVKVDAGLRSIDKFSGRLGILVSSLVAVGPAAVPIAALAIPAVTALGGSVVSLGLGVGVTELAFHGLGSTLTAFNKAAAAPTASNIAAAQTAMDKLPPSAQRLVLELHQLNPELDKLRQSAAGGLVPGVTAGLHSLVTDAPLVRTAVKGISSELGVMAHQTGDALASDQWRPFIRFAGQEAPVALHTLGAATGDVAHGLAEILMALGPLNRNVDAGILKLAQDFDRWATSLGKTKDFQSFVQYIETNGPKVISLLGDTAQLFGHIVEAAAPLGGPTVQALDLIVKALDAIASSPLATPLLALAQLYSITRLLGRGFNGINTSLTSGGGFGAKIATNAKTSLASLYTVTTASDRARLSVRELAAAEAEQSAARRSTLIKGAALAAGIGLVASGASDKIGLTNTATLALAGSMAGPLGTAAGAAVGFTLDLAHANNDLASAQDRVSASFKTTDFAAQSAAMADLTKQAADFHDSVSNAWGSKFFDPKAGLDAVSNFFTHADQEAQAFIAKQDAASLSGRIGLSRIGSALGAPGLQPLNKFGAINVPSIQNTKGIEQLTQLAQRAQPAMDALNISWERFSNEPVAIQQQDIEAIVRWINKADSAKGKTDAVANAFAQMGDQSLTADQRVQSLTGSLDALVDPMLNLGAAHDAFHQALNDLPQALSKTNKSLRGNSDAAIQNRGAIRGLISNVKDQIEAQANAGASSGKMSATLKAGRQSIIDQGRAAGLNAGQIQHMIDVMHLTPKLIKTLIQANTSQALGAIQSVNAAIAGIDRVVNVHVNVTRSTNALLADVNTPRPHGADGMTVPGPRHPYGDKTLIMAAPGEEVISNRHGQADRFRADRAMGRIPRYANGGTVATHVTSTPAGSHMTDGVRAELHHLQLSLHDATKELDKERAARQALIQQRAQLVSTVRDNFRTDIFAPQTPWGMAAGPLGTLRADIRGARQYDRIIGRLTRRGLSGGALGEITTLADAQQVARMSPEQRRRLERLYAERQRVSGRAGVDLGDARFGKQIAEQTKVVKQQAAEVHRLDQRIAEGNKHLAAIQKAAQNHAKDHAKALNGATGTAARRARKT